MPFLATRWAKQLQKMVLLREISSIDNNLKVADFVNRVDCLYHTLYPVSGEMEDVSKMYLKVIKIYLKKIFSKNFNLQYFIYPV